MPKGEVRVSDMTCNALSLRAECLAANRYEPVGVQRDPKSPGSMVDL